MMDRKTFFQLPLLVPFLRGSEIHYAQRPPEPATGTCATCKFFASTNRTSGNCQRFPKVFANGLWSFPIMGQGEKCGEYQTASTRGHEEHRP